MDEQNMNHGEGAAAGAAMKKDRFLPVSILVAGFVIGGSVIFATVFKGAPAPAAPQDGTGSAPTAPAAAPSSVTALGVRDAILGNANAPVTLIEYGDYQCPFCTRWFSETEPLVKQSYVDTGKVKMVFRNFAFLGPESIAAAEAAECAEDQNQFWPYHEALYAAKVGDENRGGGENDGFYTRTLFLKLASQLKLDVPAFTGCIDGHKHNAEVGQEKTLAGSAGVNSTPSFLVNGTLLVGAQPFAAFQQAINAILKG